jgi:hypothetical protein
MMKRIDITDQGGVPMDSDTPKSVEFSGYVAWRKPKRSTSTL